MAALTTVMTLGQTIWREEEAGAFMGSGVRGFDGRNLPEKAAGSKAKWPKKAPSRAIAGRNKSAQKNGLVMSEPRQTTDSETNPLLKAWVTPFATPPFDEIAPEHFLPAFEQAFADHSAEIAAIAHEPAAPDFPHTIAALERAGKRLR